MMNTLNLNAIQKLYILYRSNRSQTEIAITNEAIITITTVIPWACTLALSLQNITTDKMLTGIFSKEIQIIYYRWQLRRFISLVLLDKGLKL